jgi:hypothetical protein
MSLESIKRQYKSGLIRQYPSCCMGVAIGAISPNHEMPDEQIIASHNAFVNKDPQVWRVWQALGEAVGVFGAHNWLEPPWGVENEDVLLRLIADGYRIFGEMNYQTKWGYVSGGHHTMGIMPYEVKENGVVRVVGLTGNGKNVKIYDKENYIGNILLTSQPGMRRMFKPD